MPANPGLTPDQILGELADLWVTLGKRGEAETGMGVLRACSLSLVVLAEESDDFQALGETLAALMPEHPARTFVIRLRPGAGLTGRVFAQCWMPFGQRRQICCEQVEVTASESTLGDAIDVVAAATASDLPVVAWCRSARLLEQAAFHKFARFAARVVVDSAAFPDPKAAIGSLAQLAAQDVLLADLSWTRLTRWRDVLSRTLENRDCRTRLPARIQVAIAFGGETPSVSARYMAAWLSGSLRTAGANVSVSLQSDPSALPGQLGGVELTGEELRIELKRTDGCLRVVVNGLSQPTGLPPASDYLLMREELGILQRDPIFERTLVSAKNL